MLLKDNFPILVYAWHEASNIFLNFNASEILAENLCIEHYSHDVKEYWVKVIVVNSFKKVDTISKYFSIKTKILHNFYVIDWQDLMKLNQQQAISLQAKMYLDAIKEIPNIRGMKKRQFNIELFYHDVELLFKKEKLIID